MRPFLAVLVFCTLSNGCGNYFAPNRNVKEALTDSDVIGRWKMTAKSLNLLTRDGFRSEPAHTYTITFHKDGTCVFQSVEEFGRKGTYISANGVWKLGHDIKRGENARVKNAIRMELNVEQATHFRDLDFTRQDGVLMLWEFYGDPDQWEFIEYVRDGDQSTFLGPVNTTNAPAIPPPDDPYPPPLLALGAILGIMLVVVMGMLVLGLGLAVGFVFCGLVGAFTAFGILSSSVAIGFLRRSAGSGFRALFLQLGAAGGVACGIAAVWLVCWLAGSSWSVESRIGIGAACGLVSGILSALLFNFTWSNVAGKLYRRYGRRQGEPKV